MKNESINPTGGRKGCGGCFSESHELMQFNGILPTDCELNNVLHEVSGTRDDIKAVFSFVNISLDKVASEKRQMEEVLS